MDFNEATDGGVAVASAGPNVNHLHLTADTTMPAPHHSIFYRLSGLADTEPTVSKH